jgi:hypothetical protein
MGSRPECQTHEKAVLCRIIRGGAGLVRHAIGYRGSDSEAAKSMLAAAGGTP